MRTGYLTPMKVAKQAHKTFLSLTPPVCLIDLTLSEHHSYKTCPGEVLQILNLHGLKIQETQCNNWLSVSNLQ